MVTLEHYEISDGDWRTASVTLRAEGTQLQLQQLNLLLAAAKHEPLHF